jgi:hypothetical protein
MDKIKLEEYFKENRVLTDDQTIIINCILTHEKSFKLFYENNGHNNWFMFRRILLNN